MHKRYQLFGAKWNAYDYKWTQAGVHNPEYEDQEINKNIATAVAAAQYTREPVFGIHILPAWTDSNRTAYIYEVASTLPRKWHTFCRYRSSSSVLNGQQSAWVTALQMIQNGM
jgi:hypothetical protein